MRFHEKPQAPGGRIRALGSPASLLAALVVAPARSSARSALFYSKAGGRIVLAALVLFAAAPAQAHKLKVFATAESGVVTGTAYFSGGAKAMGVPGRVTGADGRLVAEFRTDGEGGFSFKAAESADLTITVDAQDGHVAAYRVGAGEIAPAAEAAPGDQDLARLVEAAVARQVRPLREQLDASEERIRLHDLLGGFGTIFGVFGLLAWNAARKTGRGA